MAEIALPLAFLGLSASLKALGRYYDVDTNTVLYAIGPQTKEIIKQIVSALSLVSEMCRNHEHVKFEPHEMAFFLQGFQIPLNSKDDFSKYLKDKTANKEENAEAELEITLKQFHNYIDNAIYALTKFEKIFEINSTEKKFDKETIKAYRKLCGEKSIGGKTNEICIFSSIFVEMEKHREQYGSCEFVNIISIFKKLTKINETKYQIVEATMNSTTRCFSFLTSTDCKTAVEYHKGLIISHSLAIDDLKKEGITINNEGQQSHYTPQQLWKLV